MSFKQIKLKYNSLRNLEGLGSKQIKTYCMVVEVNKFPHTAIEGQLNSLIPFSVEKDSTYFNNTSKDLQENPELFALRSPAIILLADSIENNQGSSTLTINFNESQYSGLIAGSYTLAAITDFLNTSSFEEQESLNSNVEIRVITGLPASDVEETVNRLNAVFLKGEIVDGEEIRPVRQVLEASGLSKYVGYNYQDFETAKIDIRGILTYLVLLNPLKYEPESLIFTLQSKKKVAQAYRSLVVAADRDAMVGKKFDSLLYLLPSFLKLRDTIYQELPQIWNSLGEENYSDKKFVYNLHKSPLLANANQPLVEKMPSVPDAFLYPLLATFRHNLELSVSGYRWKVKPENLWEEVKLDLVKKVRDFAKSNSFDTAKLGRDKNYWTSMSEAMLLKLLLLQK